MRTPTVTEVRPPRAVLRETREIIVENLLDAQAENNVQARLLCNSTPEVDSLREVLVALAEPRLGVHRRLRLAALGLRLVDEAARSNAVERARVRDSTGAAERIGRKPLTVREAARELRAPLADLCNPMIGAARRETARAAVIDVLDRAPHGLLHDASGRPRAGIAGELNSVAKTTALADVIAGWLA